jgi:hypothetical protein
MMKNVARLRVNFSVKRAVVSTSDMVGEISKVTRSLKWSFYAFHRQVKKFPIFDLLLETQRVICWKSSNFISTPWFSHERPQDALSS